MTLTQNLTRLTHTDHGRVLWLFHYAPRQHLHLDWHSLEQWLSDPALCCRVLRGEDSQVSLLMGATINRLEEVPGRRVAWLRFLLPDQNDEDNRLLDSLWEALRADLIAKGVRQLGTLLLQSWVTNLIARWGFAPAYSVVTLRRLGGPLPAEPEPPYVIREVTHEADLDVAAAIDAQAFEPLWQYNRATLRIAMSQAATFSLLERDGEALGYQLSTVHGDAGHLARLAVLPTEQGKGLGKLLVGSMLRFMLRRGINTVTVNTQSDNARSQRLYRRLGFEHIGEGVPVWTLDL